MKEVGLVEFKSGNEVCIERFFKSALTVKFANVLFNGESHA